MLKQFRIIILALTVISSSLTLPTLSFAQGESQASAEEMGGTRKQIATIIFAGLAGAILGLSTLSFYGRPQDKLSNIAIGFAVGVISGTVYTTYKAIHAPYEQYQVDLNYEKQDELLRTNFESQQFEMLSQQQNNRVHGFSAQVWTF
jgi:hypothetical protein